MALISCKECGKEISDQASSCPNCGFPVKEQLQQPPWQPQPKSTQEKEKKKGSKWWLIIVVIVGIFVLFKLVGGSPNNITQTASVESSKTDDRKYYNMGQQVDVGYMSYVAWQAKWSHRLSSNPYLDQKPNARYLIIQITARNNDKKARTIPPFRLIDEDGAEYDTTSNAFILEGALGLLDDLNPGVQKEGFIVFDVPTHHDYKLKLSGGYWSSDEALVEIIPQVQ